MGQNNSRDEDMGKQAEERMQERVHLDIDSRLSQIFAWEEGRKVFDRILPGLRERTEGQPATLGFSVRKLASYSRGAVPEEALKKLNEELGRLELYTVEGETVYTEDYPLTAEAAKREEPQTYEAVYPGRIWRDTEGKRIQAHGGAVFYENGTYYWYGENKDRTDGRNPVWTWGIRAYRSEDLYSWEDLGLIIEPDLKNRVSGLYPEKHLDRPHIVRCQATGKYVCWIKQSGEEACFIILQAEAFTGPYVIIQENYRPEGIKVGDFDMFVEQDGRAYMFMDADHAGVYGYELTADYLGVERRISSQYEGLHAPFCREGITLFERNGKKYMLTSGMSGYIPNKSDAAAAESFERSFVSMGNPHVKDDSNASFNSQISQVFKVPGKEDLYIAIADRWVPGYPVDARRADLLERGIAAHYEPEKYTVTNKEQREIMESPMLESADTSMADYVWLPLSFEGEKVKIAWRDAWRIEDYQ